MSEQAKVEVSQEMEQFISYVEKLSVLDLSKLVKALEQRLGVSAAAPVAAHAPARPGVGATAGETAMPVEQFARRGDKIKGAAALAPGRPGRRR